MSPWQKRENIELFLKAAKEYLQLKPSDLFETQDLYENRYLVRVYHTIKVKLFAYC